MHRLSWKIILSLLLLILILTGCDVARSEPPIADNTPIPTGKPTFVSSQTPTFLAIQSSQPTPSIKEIDTLCSPLEGINLNELYAITSNSFSYPSPFADTGHHGVDLAFYKFKNFSTIHGHPVEAILPGRVVQVIDDRFPYGNMILIETKLDSLSGELKSFTAQPTPIPVENIGKFNTCSKDYAPIPYSSQSKSLYSLYSHLDSKPDLMKGDIVSCGQRIGEVGISGNSIADHLHVEFRIGPSDAQFRTLSSYKEDSTSEERYNYCIWSISGIFQAIDPAMFWSDQ